jgi:hypothetical protein
MGRNAEDGIPIKNIELALVNTFGESVDIGNILLGMVFLINVLVTKV